MPPAVDAWTEEDQQRCLSLMCKARDAGMLQMLFKKVMDADGSWDFIPAVETGSSMNDASKRLREEDSSTSYHDRGYGGLVPPPMAPLVKPDVPKLPSGVSSLEDWGRNLISFGKLKGKRSYASLCNSTGKEDVEYKKWLHAHFSKGSPQHRDLVEYLIAMKDRTLFASGDSQSVMFPGTDVPRRYAS